MKRKRPKYNWRSEPWSLLKPVSTHSCSSCLSKLPIYAFPCTHTPQSGFEKLKLWAVWHTPSYELQMRVEQNMCCYFVIKTCQNLHDIMTAVCFTAEPSAHKHKLIAGGEKEKARVSAGLHQLSGGRELCCCLPALVCCKAQILQQPYPFLSLSHTHTCTEQVEKHWTMLSG